MGPVFDARTGLERTVVWLVALAVVSGLAWSVTGAADLRRDVPETEFAVSLDDEAGVLIVRHAGGDAIRDRSTTALWVALVDDRTGATATVTWAGDEISLFRRGNGFPVERGSRVVVDDPTADTDGDGSTHDGTASVGFELSPGDVIRVVWRGSRRTGDIRNVTLAERTAG